MGDRTLDFIALGVLIFVILTLIYGIIFIHDIPYEIAKKRKHPHQDAIHTAGWVSLFLMHTIWPFLWIWATLYKPGFGWGFTHQADTVSPENKKESTAELLSKITLLEQRQRRKDAEIREEIRTLKETINTLEKELQQGEEE